MLFPPQHLHSKKTKDLKNILEHCVSSGSCKGDFGNCKEKCVSL